GAPPYLTPGCGLNGYSDKHHKKKFTRQDIPTYLVAFFHDAKNQHLAIHSKGRLHHACKVISADFHGDFPHGKSPLVHHSITSFLCAVIVPHMERSRYL
ncbi:MAG: hypothetical protein SOV40_03975, partial [Prevotella sp.]|nr:hypothetical protein [Prevotella sp.]